MDIQNKLNIFLNEDGKLWNVRPLEDGDDGEGLIPYKTPNSSQPLKVYNDPYLANILLFMGASVLFTFALAWNMLISKYRECNRKYPFDGHKRIQCKIELKQKEINLLQDTLKTCRDSKNPLKCRYAIQMKIAKIKND